MEAGLMKVVWCLCRSWTHFSYFNLQYSWSTEEMSWYPVENIPNVSLCKI